MLRTNRLCVALLLLLLSTSCATTETPVRREETARPRVEQRALSRAMDEAFSKVDFSLIMGKSTFVETQAISKIDIGFLTAYINNKVIENGGLPISKEEDADIKILNIAKISGTDEIKRKILLDKVRGQYKSTLTFINMKSKKVIKIYELDAEADETR
jgi:hypothetical protein